MTSVQLAALVATFILGFLIGKAIKPRTHGTLVVDHSDPDVREMLFLELNETTDLDYIYRNETVSLKIEKRDYLEGREFNTSSNG